MRRCAGGQGFPRPLTLPRTARDRAAARRKAGSEPLGYGLQEGLPQRGNRNMGPAQEDA